MVHVVSISHKGTKSSVNEDACIALASKGIFVVADGVGGGPSGDFASRTLVEEIDSMCRDGENSEEDLLLAIQVANEKIFSAAQDSRLNGMATTVVAVVLDQESLMVCHVGDSRAYRLRSGQLTPLTKDHSKIVEKGNDVRKQVVTNALGIRESVKVEISRSDFVSGDLLFLMTDGVSDVLDDAVICEILNGANRSVSDRVLQLVSESEARGGKDDKTVLCVF